MIAYGATAAAVVPILVAGIRGAARGWTPTGDGAFSAVRAWDVFSSDRPLLGTWSSASRYTGHEYNHPGPLQFDFLALPVRLLGHGVGTAVGMALINAIAVVLIAWLLWRRDGTTGVTVGMAAAALLTWSMGSEMLYEPWSQYAPVLPFALFGVAVWCAAAGDVVALPVLVVAGSYALQTHLSYSVLVPGLAAFAVVVCLGRLWSRKELRKALRWAGITVGVALVSWAQPLWQQLTVPGEGNLMALYRSLDAKVENPGLERAVVAYGGTVAVPPMWLPPSYGEPSFNRQGIGRPTWMAATGLILLAVALVVLAWRAWRRGSRARAFATLGGLLALWLGLVTTQKMHYRYGLGANYARFMWPLGMIVWLAVVFAVIEEVRARRAEMPGRRFAIGALALAVVAGIATLPTVNNETSTTPWSVEGVRAIDDDVLAALHVLEDEGCEGVLVEFDDHFAAWMVGFPVFGMLQEAGVPFYVQKQHLVSQLGRDRKYSPGDADHRLIIRLGESPPGADEELLASWTATPAQEREVDIHTLRVRVYLADM